MISRLTGMLASKKAPQILVDCQGIGYEADVSMMTYYQLPEVGERVSIWTHLQIKDDAHTLIGFTTEQERKLFRQLIKINGVGAKMALTILSGIDIEAFGHCVRQNDVSTLTCLPGVGKKTAERLIIEMRDKVDEFTGSSTTVNDTSLSHPVDSQAYIKEANEALQALGYKPLDAEKMVRQVTKTGNDIDSAATLIRKALQESVQRR